MNSTLLPQPQTRLKRTKAFQNAYLIFNPATGGGNADRELAIIRSLLEPHLNLKICLTTPDTDAADLAKSAIAQHADLIIAAGGDGTVSAAASAVINTGIPLAVIPRGTANAFVNGLGLPDTVEAACISILQGATRTVGTVKCNGKFMLLLAGIGFEAETVQAANRELKDKFGILAYVIAGLGQLQRTQKFAACLETEQETITVPAIAITVASIAPPTSILAQGTGELRPDDEFFDITILSPTSAIDVLTSAVDLFTNGLVQSTSDNDHIGYLRVNKVTITADPPQQIALDGEMFGTTPATFEMLPQSLVVVMDYNQFRAEQRKLVGLPGVDIVEKQNYEDEIVLNEFLPVNLFDVFSEQFVEVSQATLNLWHTVTTALKEVSTALLECVIQTVHQSLWAIHSAIEGAPSPTADRKPTATLNQVIRVVHQTIGRIRLKIPRLSSDSLYRDQVCLQLQQLAGVQDITINPLASSIAIQFDRKLPVAEMEPQILAALSQVA